MKTVLKLILYLVIGMLFGVLIASVAVVLVTDITLDELIFKLGKVNIAELAGAIAVGAASFVFSVFFLVILHEAGHLICGLLSGYRFVSFRIFNFAFIRCDGKFRVKRFSVAGTGGQCLLSPPDRPLKDIPVAWYNAGGVLANLIAILAVIPLMFADVSPYVHEFAVIFVITDAFLIITNGIPMQVGGIGNDATNILLLRRDLDSKRGFVLQLQSNEMIQNGTRPKDMPASWFVCDEIIDYKNPFKLAVPIMAASRLIDENRWEEAYNVFDRIYANKSEIMPLYAKEVSCELMFLALVTSRKSVAESLFDKDLEKYIATYRKMMSSKDRVACAVELYLKNDMAAAMSIYENLKLRQADYLLQGEVKSDIAILDKMFEIYNP